MIKLTIHAAERKARYGMAQRWIDAAVMAPDWTTADPVQPGVTWSFKAVIERGERILRVVHRPDGTEILVLTAFFDRGAKR
jgi:hypothetical protein